MFNLDKMMDEWNKEKLYGKKPKLPEKIKQVQLLDADGNCYASAQPSKEVIVDTINNILEYLEWLDK